MWSRRQRPSQDAGGVEGYGWMGKGYLRFPRSQPTGRMGERRKHNISTPSWVRGGAPADKKRFS